MIPLMIPSATPWAKPIAPAVTITRSARRKHRGFASSSSGDLRESARKEASALFLTLPVTIGAPARQAELNFRTLSPERAQSAPAE